MIEDFFCHQVGFNNAVRAERKTMRFIHKTEQSTPKGNDGKKDDSDC